MAGVKVLTLRQPWASLVALGVKSIETRSWSTSYRGPLAIHAAVRRPRPASVGDWSPYVGALVGWAMEHYASGEIGAPPDAPLPLGAIVATCTLVDVVPMVEGHLPEQSHVSVGRGLYLDTYTPGGGVATRDLYGQRPYGLFEPGRYAWLLADVVPVDPPVPFRGGQGLSRTWEAES